MSKDKNVIWDDCAQCAYKHLAAAYAEMTEIPGGALLWVEGEDILVARAVIALSEVRAGYKGNVDIAVGCLAAAETRADSAHASLYRWVRLKLQRGQVEEASNGLVNPVRGWTEAHITEAIREFTELVEDGIPDFLAMTNDETLDWLKAKITYIRDTYEIGKAEPEIITEHKGFIPPEDVLWDSTGHDLQLHQFAEGGQK
jgi:hypothetical protein